MVDILEIQKGNVAGHSIVHKFGRNPDVDIGSTPEDIWNTGGEVTWQILADTLAIVSASANDDAGASGAQEIAIEGLDEDFNAISEAIALDGATPVTTVNRYLRVFRSYVTQAGTYHGSNEGAITATYTTSTDTAFTIGLGTGQTELGLYTVPAEKIGMLLSATLNVDSGSSKTAQITLNQCPNAQDVTTPFTGAARRVLTFDGINGQYIYTPRAPIVFDERTDIWFACEVATANNTPISVDFDVMLVDVKSWRLKRGKPPIGAAV